MQNPKSNFSKFVLPGLTAALLSMLKSVQKLEGPQCLKN